VNALKNNVPEEVRNWGRKREEPHSKYRFWGKLSPRVFKGGFKYSVTKVESLWLSPDVFVNNYLIILGIKQKVESFWLKKFRFFCCLLYIPLNVQNTPLATYSVMLFQ